MSFPLLVTVVETPEFIARTDKLTRIGTPSSITWRETRQPAT
ncbi:MAG: hypothetical protein ABW318_13885 [Vicinamibacterales bacterium]